MEENTVTSGSGPEVEMEEVVLPLGMTNEMQRRGEVCERGKLIG
jgi:hypothetical protein